MRFRVTLFSITFFFFFWLTLISACLLGWCVWQNLIALMDWVFVALGFGFNDCVLRQTAPLPIRTACNRRMRIERGSKGIWDWYEFSPRVRVSWGTSREMSLYGINIRYVWANLVPLKESFILLVVAVGWSWYYCMILNSNPIFRLVTLPPVN